MAKQFDLMTAAGQKSRSRFASIGAWTLAANFLHDSGWFGEPDNQLRQPAYNVVNASLDWHLQNTPYSIELWGQNLPGMSWYTRQLRAMP
jgi:iron complex outermembrane receptor protein